MIPIIALVGRSNVGKSTLFNRLTQTRDALVANFPGLTRDRQYAHAEFEGNEFIIVDTGGIDGHQDGVEKCIVDQSFLAIAEANIVLFIVDARAGLMPADQEIAQYLRNCQKTTFVIANKIDGLASNAATADFYALGLSEVYAIAASRGRGIKQLIKHILLPSLLKKEGSFLQKKITLLTW